MKNLRIPNHILGAILRLFCNFYKWFLSIAETLFPDVIGVLKTLIFNRFMSLNTLFYFCINSFHQPNDKPTRSKFIIMLVRYVNNMGLANKPGNSCDPR